MGFFQVVPGQMLWTGDGNVSDPAPKVRLPLFGKWAWTHDTTAKLENMDIHVDRWPWEDCGGCVDGLDKHDFTNYAESLG